MINFFTLTVGIGVNALFDGIVNYKIVTVGVESKCKIIKRKYFQIKILFNALYLTWGLVLYFHFGHFISSVLFLLLGALVNYFITFEISDLKLKKNIVIIIFSFFFFGLFLCAYRLDSNSHVHGIDSNVSHLKGQYSKLNSKDKKIAEEFIDYLASKEVKR